MQKMLAERNANRTNSSITNSSQKPVEFKETGSVFAESADSH